MASTSVVPLRISQDLVVALDARVAKLKRERPGYRITRSDVMREALHKFLGTTPEQEPDHG